MLLMPPKPDTCPICATEHSPEQPHNKQSLYYQYRFYGVRGRWPTWADAVAHCDPETQRLWREVLEERAAWSEPADGSDPIADPPGESFHQAIGDVNAPDFGPQQETT